MFDPSPGTAPPPCKMKTPKLHSQVVIAIASIIIIIILLDKSLLCLYFKKGTIRDFLSKDLFPSLRTVINIYIMPLRTFINTLCITHNVTDWQCKEKKSPFKITTHPLVVNYNKRGFSVEHFSNVNRVLSSLCL